MEHSRKFHKRFSFLVIFLYIISNALTILFFQNCSQSKKYSETTKAVDSSSTNDNTNTGGGGQTQVNTVIIPSSLAYAETNLVLKKDAIYTGGKPSYSGSPATFTVSPLLPKGLSISSVSGVISGIPTELQSNTNYSITATNSAGKSTVNIMITIKSWWNNTAKERISLSVKNNTTLTMTNYPVQLLIKSGDSRFANMSADCSNLRFVNDDDTTALNHWVETCSANNRQVWVKIPTLSPNATKTIYIYFTSISGNPSDGEKTFDFFDGMETVKGWAEDSYNNTSACNGSWRGHGAIQGAGSYETGTEKAPGNDTVQAQSGAKALLLWVDCGEDYAIGIGTGLTVIGQSYSYRVRFSYHTTHTSYHGLDPTSGAHYYYQSNGSSYVELENTGSTDFQWTQREDALTDSFFRLRVQDTDGKDVNAVRLHVDNLFVRKFISPEPSIAVGDLEKTF